MSSPVWFVKMLEKTSPQRFWMARMSRLPLIGKGIDYLLFDGDDVIFLPKDRAIRVDEEVEAENIVLPSRVVEAFIDKANYIWKMDTCICRAGAKCKDYPVDLACLFMGEAAMGINPRLGRRVSREEAREHMRKCREAGLFHIIGRNKLDSMYLNLRPGTKLLTVCNCCSCCCLWKILPMVSHKISNKVHRMPGVEVTVTDGCVGCGSCEETCIAKAIRVDRGRAVISEECRGCGQCIETCPEEAIELTIGDPSFIDSLIPRITSLVDVT